MWLCCFSCGGELCAVGSAREEQPGVQWWRSARGCSVNAACCCGSQAWPAEGQRGARQRLLEQVEDGAPVAEDLREATSHAEVEARSSTVGKTTAARSLAAAAPAHRFGFGLFQAPSACQGLGLPREKRARNTATALAVRGVEGRGWPGLHDGNKRSASVVTAWL